MSARVRTQLRELFPILSGLYIPVLILVLIARWASFLLSIPIGNLTRDPSTLTGSSPFIGALSHIGVLFWCAATTICFFSFTVLDKKARREEFPLFFLFGGLISLILLIDDLFLFHEVVFPVYLNIPEKLVYLAYVLIIIGYVARFAKLILKTDFIFLILAFSWFGLSIILDLLEFKLSIPILFEDGAKLFGIVSWFGYFARSGFQIMNSTQAQPTESHKPRLLSAKNIR
jgi:hypothetical protein